MIIAPRFCGPPKSGNGGYVCGRLAEHIDGTARVRLNSPPPLDTPLVVTVADDVVRLLHGDAVIAEARPATLELAPPEPPSFEEAVEAAKSYPGFARHAFPRCFGCGPECAPGEGLRIFPGPIEARALVAAPWIPEASLAEGRSGIGPEFLWTALDCTSGWAVLPVPEGKAVVLGELCARIDAAIAPLENCTVIGWALEVDGRKRQGGSAVFGADGRAAAVARATWIEVPVEAFTAR